MVVHNWLIAQKPSPTSVHTRSRVYQCLLVHHAEREFGTWRGSSTIPGLESVKTVLLMDATRRLTKNLFSNPWRNVRKSVSMVVHKVKRVKSLLKFQKRLMPDKPT